MIGANSEEQRTHSKTRIVSLSRRPPNLTFIYVCTLLGIPIFPFKSLGPTLFYRDTEL